MCVKGALMGRAMRTDVTHISYDRMSAELRALMAYESNGALDMPSPQKIIDRIRAETPVVRWDNGVGFFEMSDVLAAARNRDIVSSDPSGRPPFGMGSSEPLIPLHIDGPAHRMYRQLLDPLLSPRRIAPHEQNVRRIANQLIDGFIEAGRVELFEAFCVPLPSTVFLSLFGLPMEDRPQLVSFKDRILRNQGVTMDERERLGQEAGAELDDHLRQRLRERRATRRHSDDLLESFMQIEVDGRSLTEDEVVNLMHMFTVAGLDTVTSSLSCMMAWLAGHPEVRRRVVADPALLGRAVEEFLRFESPVAGGGPRWAAQDTEVNGVCIQQGERVFVCWASANLDPAVFEHPDEVDIDRPTNHHVAFATGFRRCLGSHLARAELRWAIDQFHRRIPDYHLAEKETVRYERSAVRQVTYLPITFSTTGQSQ
jgi:cytochrome P450